MERPSSAGGRQTDRGPNKGLAQEATTQENLSNAAACARAFMRLRLLAMCATWPLDIEVVSPWSACSVLRSLFTPILRHRGTQSFTRILRNIWKPLSAVYGSTPADRNDLPETHHSRLCHARATNKSLEAGSCLHYHRVAFNASLLSCWHARRRHLRKEFPYKSSSLGVQQKPFYNNFAAS